MPTAVSYRLSIRVPVQDTAVAKCRLRPTYDVQWRDVLSYSTVGLVNECTLAHWLCTCSIIYTARRSSNTISHTCVGVNIFRVARHRSPICSILYVDAGQTLYDQHPSIGPLIESVRCYSLMRPYSMPTENSKIYHIDVGVFTTTENHRIPISTLRVRLAYTQLSYAR